MKDNNLNTLLFKPFNLIAGWKAFFLGMVIVLITTVIGYYSNVLTVGLELKATLGVNLMRLVILAIIGIVINTLIMYLISLPFAKNVRLHDIAGTVTLSRFPQILAALCGFTMSKDFTMQLTSSMQAGSLDAFFKPSFLFFTIVSILVTIWYIALLYNGFTVSTNIKGGKAIGIFIAYLFISEILIVVSLIKL